MNIREQFLGMVRKGVYYILAPQGFENRPMRLTGIQMTEAASPEAEEIDLLDYVPWKTWKDWHKPMPTPSMKSPR